MKSIARTIAGAAVVLCTAMSANAQMPPPAPAKAATPAQQMFGEISPKFAELTDNVLFGDVWERPGLSKRDRSLITVSALIAMNRPDQVRPHMIRARDNGVTQEELIEAMRTWRSMPAGQAP